MTMPKGRGQPAQLTDCMGPLHLSRTRVLDSGFLHKLHLLAMQKHIYQAPGGWRHIQCKEKCDGERVSKGSPQDMEEQSHHSASARCLAVQTQADT